MSTAGTPGRRAAARRAAPRRPAPGPGAIVAVVLLVLCAGLVVSAAFVQGQQHDAAAEDLVPVDRTVAGCLQPGMDARGTVATLAAPVADLPESSTGALEVTGPDGSPLPGVSTPEPTRGSLSSLERPGRAAALVVTATGAPAVGRATFQRDRADSGAVAARECLAPRASWWFTGGGADLDHTSTLVLANVDPGRAVVDVVVHGPDGELPTVGTRGVALEPGEVRTFDTVDLAPQAEEMSVHVEATRGRVVAGMSDAFSPSPGATAGFEWLPAQARPSRVLRLGPLPRRADSRTLVVANPSDREVLAEVEVSGEGGAFAPTESAQLRLPPMSVVSADLSEVVGREASAVVVRAAVAVTATVRSVAGSDVGYAAAMPGLTGPAAAPVAGRASVQLTAAGAGGEATVLAFDDAGKRLTEHDLEIEPGATAAWSPPRGAAYVVVEPRRGRVAGGVTVTAGSSTTQVVLRPLPITQRRPAVVPVVR